MAAFHAAALKHLIGHLAAHLILALAGAAGLLHFRSIDVVQPDLCFTDPNGVAINDTGFA